jgi:hypothetical protein
MVMAKPSYSDLVESVFANRAKVIEVREPKPGFRHQDVTKYIWHRYPVKGGISLSELIVLNVARNNALLDRLEKRGMVKTYRSGGA